MTDFEQTTIFEKIMPGKLGPDGQEQDKLEAIRGKKTGTKTMDGKEGWGWSKLLAIEW